MQSMKREGSQQYLEAQEKEARLGSKSLPKEGTAWRERGRGLGSCQPDGQTLLVRMTWRS